MRRISESDLHQTRTAHSRGCAGNGSARAIVEVRLTTDGDQGRRSDVYASPEEPVAKARAGIGPRAFDWQFEEAQVSLRDKPREGRGRQVPIPAEDIEREDWAVGGQHIACSIAVEGTLRGYEESAWQTP